MKPSSASLRSQISMKLRIPSARSLLSRESVLPVRRSVLSKEEERLADSEALLKMIEQSYCCAADQRVPDWTPMKVDRVVNESNDVKSFYLVPTHHRPLPRFQAGQHVAISNKQHIADHGLNFAPQSRCYTLSGISTPKIWRISVKRQQAPVDGSRDVSKSFSNYLHNYVKAGHALLVRGPSGHFTLQSAGDRPIVLLAAGIGVTPLISMIHESVHHYPQRPVFAFYQSQTPEQAALSSELALLAQQHSALKLSIAFSKVPQSQSATDPTGRIAFLGGRFATDDVVKRLPNRDNAHCFLCGPNQWMHDLVESLVNHGFERDRVHFESFGGVMPGRNSEADTSDTSSAEGSFTVSLRESKQTTQYESKCGSLLDQLQKSGADVLGGCRSGNCGTCMVKLLSGNVTHGSHTFKDLPAGWILPCVSKLTSDIELEV